LLIKTLQRSGTASAADVPTSRESDIVVEQPVLHTQFVLYRVDLTDNLDAAEPGDQMKIQVNSDKTIDVDANLTRFVEGEVSSVLARFATKLTRVEIHLSDVDNTKTGKADKSCLVEVRPAGERPLSASAKAADVESAVSGALRKMQRSLATFFGRRGRSAVEVSTPVPAAKKAVARKPLPNAKKKTAAKKSAVEKPKKLSPRGPKKKGIYQARRKSSPSR
jgi:ribosome-associated translation inhibitor RaiA